MSNRSHVHGVLLVLIGLMSLAACGKSSSSGSSATSSATSLVSVSQGSSVIDAEYEASMTWSQPNHLYIHYKRIVDTMQEYSNWTIWAWQKAPYDLSGIQIEWTMQDQSGVIAALDFSGGTPANEGHLYQTSQPMSQITRLGFLIVLRSSMRPGSPGMWTSDGGTDIYINDFNTHIRSDGSVHIFAVQGAVSDYEFTYSGTEATDPYANDTGQLESISNVNSSVSSYQRAITAPDFYNRVGSGYQVFVRSFADSDGDGEGDIKGITQKLDYIEQLGVKALWLTPVHKSETYHGYDVSDFYMIDPSIGTLLDYAELIYEAHARDIRVIMDLVVNHTSTQNVWFQKSLNLKKGTDSAGNEIDYRNFYHWRYDPTHALQAPWHRFGTTNYYYYGKFATGMPELNYDYQGTRDAMVDVAKYWAAFGVDGFRIDAVKHIYMADEAVNQTGDVVVNDYDAGTQTDYSSNRTKNVNFFKELNFRIKSVYPDVLLLGENFDGYDLRMAPYYEGMDSQFDFHNYYHLVNMMHGIESGSPQAESFAYATKYNTHFKQYRDQPINSPFTSNHDLPRVINHVMGNKINNNEVKAAQTVSASNYQTAWNKALAFNATTLLMPGISWIYYGDELGMTGNWVLNDETTNYPGSDYHVDRWYRQPMKWANTATSFDTGYMFEGYTVQFDGVNSTNTVPGASEQMSNPNSMARHFKAINDYKHANPSLIGGTYSAINTGRNDIFAFQVQGTSGSYYVYINFGSSTQSGYRNGGATLGLGINGASADSLPAYSAAVLR